MAKLKKQDRAKQDLECVEPPTKKSKKRAKPPPDDEVRTTMFRDYDVSDLPTEALPVYGHPYKGLHSYTVHINGAVA